MNVYLLPHHRLDPRFRYTLEREASAGAAGDGTGSPRGLLRRFFSGVIQGYRKLKTDYDNVVHGHEHIRLSRLVLMMDRDPELTLVIPAGMTREAAMEAVRGIVRSGLMALRSSAIRNVITALVMMIVLFGAVPTHVAAVIFYPLIGLYAWGRYWEDRLIRRTMTHLLEVGMASDGHERFREEPHLGRLEQLLRETHKTDVAYQQAVAYLDGVDERPDGQSTPAHALLFKYYDNIGRFDPYERYQDRIRKKLVETAKLVAHHLWSFWKAAFWWSISTTRIARVHVPNLIFVLLATVPATYGANEYVKWRTNVVQTFPKFVRATVEFPEHAKIVVEAWPLSALQSGGAPDNPDAPPAALFDLICPADSHHIDLWSVVSDMIVKHDKHRAGRQPCASVEGTPPHGAEYKIHIKY